MVAEKALGGVKDFHFAGLTFALLCCSLLDFLEEHQQVTFGNQNYKTKLCGSG